MHLARPALILALCAVSPALAQPKTYDSVEALLADAKAGKASGHVTLQRVLVVTDPEDVADDDEHYREAFYVQDTQEVNGEVKAVGEALRVVCDVYYYGGNPFDEESDDSWEDEIPVGVKKGDVITIAGDLDQDWQDDTWELQRFIDDYGWWDSSYFEAYVEGGIDVYDFQHASAVLGNNWGIDDLSDFSMDTHSSGDAADELKEFNAFLVQTMHMQPITKAADIDDRADQLWDLDHGLRAVVTVHSQGTQPVTATPEIRYVRPYTRLRQGTVAVVKIENPGVSPMLQLDGKRLSITERLPGLLLVEIPEGTAPGQHMLTLKAGDQTSQEFRVWVKRKLAPENPAPTLEAATVVGSGRAAVVVFEGNHFTQAGDVTSYIGGRKLGRVLSRQTRTLIVELPEGVTGKTARVRVGDQRSNRISVRGLGHTQGQGGAPAGPSGAGAAGALDGALGND